MSVAFVFSLIAFAAVLATLAIRDHRRAVAARLGLLDDCRGLLDCECWSAGDDGFPALEGRSGGHPVKAALIPDTMVMRRLPQLWLSVTQRAQRPGRPALSIVARPTGNEFYAPAMDLPHRLEPPQGLPLDIIIRGDGPRAQALCDQLALELSRLLANARIKEITLTPKGTRITRQASEGRRGEHLLLRQAAFDNAPIARTDLEGTLADLALLSSALDRFDEVRAA